MSTSEAPYALPQIDLQESSEATTLRFANGKIVHNPVPFMTRTGDFQEEERMFLEVGEGIIIPTEKAETCLDKYLQLLREELKHAMLFLDKAPDSDVFSSGNTKDHTFTSNFLSLTLCTKRELRKNIKTLQLDYIKLAPSKRGYGFGTKILESLMEIAHAERFHFKIPLAIDITCQILSKIASRWSTKMRLELNAPRQGDNSSEEEEKAEDTGFYFQHLKTTARYRHMSFTPLCYNIHVPCTAEDAYNLAPSTQLINPHFLQLAEQELNFIQYCGDEKGFYGDCDFLIFEFNKASRWSKQTAHKWFHDYRSELYVDPELSVSFQCVKSELLKWNGHLILDHALIKYPFLTRCMHKVMFNGKLIGWPAIYSDIISDMHSLITAFISELVYLEDKSQGYVLRDEMDAYLRNTIGALCDGLRVEFDNETEIKKFCLEIKLISTASLPSILKKYLVDETGYDAEEAHGKEDNFDRISRRAEAMLQKGEVEALYFVFFILICTMFCSPESEQEIAGFRGELNKLLGIVFGSEHGYVHNSFLRKKNFDQEVGWSRLLAPKPWLTPPFVQHS